MNNNLVKFAAFFYSSKDPIFFTAYVNVDESNSVITMHSINPRFYNIQNIVFKRKPQGHVEFDSINGLISLQFILARKLSNMFNWH